MIPPLQLLKDKIKVLDAELIHYQNMDDQYSFDTVNIEKKGIR